MKKLTVGSLFAGIGGIDLGLERTGGFETKWQVEIDEYCNKVLAKHWPNVQRFRDVREVGKHNLPAVDLLCGGSPCQGFSTAGTRRGLEDERSSLWFEFARIIRELRPPYVLLENSANILRMGFDRVLSDLSDAGYDAEWEVVTAKMFGAPHLRRRLFLLAYPNCQYGQKRMGIIQNRTKPIFAGSRKERSEFWVQAPDSVNRVDDGVSRRLYRNRVGALGNSVVPQVIQYIGERIIAYENSLP